MSKELWLIPKRSSLHQAILFIKAIIDRGYDGATWSPSKQNDLGVNLSRFGATQNGRNVSNQSIRTLAALPQYFGFVYIDSNVTPSVIRITKAGYDLVNFHSDEIVKIPNLVVGNRNSQTIKESKIFLEQFEKLQITNPIILKDCANILIFPLLFTLRLLLKLEYLDRDEVGYFLFRTKDDSEFDLRVEEIKNFRQMDYEKRQSIIEKYKKTEFGNKTLVQAPTTSYFFTLICSTGLIERKKIILPNPGNTDDTQDSISVSNNSIDYVMNILENKYAGTKVYDFGNNLPLWIDYIGNPNRLFPPRDLFLWNDCDVPVFVKISQGKKLVAGDLLTPEQPLKFPVFLHEKYSFTVLHKISGDIVKNFDVVTAANNLDIHITDLSINENVEENIDSIIEEIHKLSSSSMFPKDIVDYLKLLYDFDGIDRRSSSILRGGYYEHYYYKLLQKLLELGYIDDVHWYGKIGKYGLPTPSPGGQQGNPDIIFKINDIHYILELTTIRARSKSMQFSAEGASVPDHIHNYAEAHPECEVIGIFSAPSIHERTKRAMRANLAAEGHVILCIKEEDLIDIFKSNSKEELQSKLNQINDN